MISLDCQRPYQGSCPQLCVPHPDLGVSVYRLSIRMAMPVCVRVCELPLPDLGIIGTQGSSMPGVQNMRSRLLREVPVGAEGWKAGGESKG